MNTTQQAQANVRAAETELARLQQVAAAAQSEAVRAQANFEHDPSEQAATTSMVATQRAKNARAQAQRYEQSELAQATEALKEAERQALKASLQASENALMRKLDVAAEALLAAIHKFDAVKDDQADFATACKHAAQFGVRSSFSFETAMRTLEQRLNDTLGPTRTSSMSFSERPVSLTVERMGAGGHAVRFKVLRAHPVPKAMPTKPDVAGDEAPAHYDA
jgi:hypothetical protein